MILTSLLVCTIFLVTSLFQFLFFGSKLSKSFQIGDEDEQSLYLYVKYCLQWFLFYPILISVAILLQEFAFNTYLNSCLEKNVVQSGLEPIDLTKHLSPNLRTILQKKGSQKIIIQCVVAHYKTLLNYPVVLSSLNSSTSIQFKIQLFLLIFVIEMLGSCYYLITKNFLASALLKISLFLFFRGKLNLFTHFSFSFHIFSLIILIVLLLYFEKSIPINKEHENNLQKRNINNGLEEKDISGLGKENKKEIEKEKGREIEIEKELEHFFKNDELDKHETENPMEKGTNQKITFGNEKKKQEQQIKRDFLIPTIIVLILFILTSVVLLISINALKKQDFSKNDYCESNTFLSVDPEAKIITIEKCAGDVEIEKREYLSKNKYLVHERIRNEFVYQLPKTNAENIVIHFKCLDYFGEFVQIYPVMPDIPSDPSKDYNKIYNKLTGEMRPNILLLFLSRTSRLSFKDNLHNTQETLLDLESKKLIKYWDFKGYRTASQSTEQNQQMIFSGQSKNIHHNHRGWIWNYFNKNYGYYTSVIDQKCLSNNSFPFNLKTPISDLKFLDQKLFTPFCDGSWLQPNELIQQGKEPRCLYGKNGHNFVFNYIKQNFENKFFAKYSKFILAFFYESFDENQSLLQTIDFDLSQFIYEFVTEKRYQNTVLLLLSEDGVDYGINSYKNHKYPLLQIIIPTETLSVIPEMGNDLGDNVMKKIINKDLYNTLLHMGDYPESMYYRLKVPSLLNGITRRSCEQVGLRGEFCKAWEKN
ncbi:hypothetical protein M0812_23796 [Anaeramoeba flamelloides]|uniref:Sulfatase N-terminal domain-containing protein n=1 Tax=Anaeramoeba flamelloides TaxID=1746091 RepID=A0AAV7YFG3_9EUKA|nr:hypothetical protein M0812_23796 [Anaeramoeba flamelloides]